jgi:NADPH:quinone reductase-like Zn-dependent oxidoreductase
VQTELPLLIGAVPALPRGGRQRLEELARLVNAGKLRPQVAELPLNHAREALARVATRHTRGKVVLEIGE